MKKTLRYPELWQKKRNELPVNGNPDAGWQQMRSLLDKQMPVTGVVKKPFRLKVPKWGLPMFVGVSSLVAVYVGSQLYLSKKNPVPAKPGTQQIQRDSLAPAVNDTLQALDTVKTTRGIPGISPFVTGAGPVNQTKFDADTTKRSRQQAIDSIITPPVLNIPMHRDSAIVPVEVAPKKVGQDSVDFGKKVIQKDTTNSKKPLKKKKRRGVSVFF